MKKIGLIYSLIVYLIAFVVSFTTMFQKIYFEGIFFLLYSSLGLFCIYNLYYKRLMRFSLSVLIITNLFQSVSFLIGGVNYNFILGSQLSLKIFRYDDLKLSFNFFPYRLEAIFESVNTESFSFEINSIQLILTLFFVSCISKYDKEMKISSMPD